MLVSASSRSFQASKLKERSHTIGLPGQDCSPSFLEDRYVEECLKRFQLKRYKRSVMPVPKSEACRQLAIAKLCAMDLTHRLMES